METRHLNERERLVIHEGGIIIGREEGFAEGIKEGIKKGIEEGREEGKAEGREEKAMDIARMMVEEGMDITTIARFTGLSEEEIAALR